MNIRTMNFWFLLYLFYSVTVQCATILEFDENCHAILSPGKAVEFIRQLDKPRPNFEAALAHEVDRMKFEVISTDDFERIKRTQINSPVELILDAWKETLTVVIASKKFTICLIDVTESIWVWPQYNARQNGLS